MIAPAPPSASRSLTSPSRLTAKWPS